MSLRSINPADERILNETGEWAPARLEEALAQAAKAKREWTVTPIEKRAALLASAAHLLRDRREKLARLMTTEMGKLIGEARAEIEKCARVCDFYTEHAARFLADEIIETEARRSYIVYQSLGTVLGIMPWNFPFWQVLRFAAPTLAAGNTVLLKHASNVSLCALAIEDLLSDVGFPPGVFIALMIASDKVAGVIEDHRVNAVTVTGSEEAGRSVAHHAAQHLKKTVLELGGSDAFIVFADADLEETVRSAVAARFQNTGQSCIAAKRFIVVEAIAEEFLRRFKDRVETLKAGDPLKETTTLAPLARKDLRDSVDAQVRDALDRGAHAVTGCRPEAGKGFYYQASILDHITQDMRVYSEEVFGPVAVVIRAQGDEQALSIANDTPFGLGGSLWTQDLAKGERLAQRLECGVAFINGIVKSDPRLPFGGIKRSGYGRELSRHGIHEFVNAKTVWIK